MPAVRCLLATALTCLCLCSPASADDKPWALRTPQRPATPSVRNGAWVRNPVDAFILAKLEAAGIAPSPEADPVTLVRRVTFDLTGLPPTPQEVEEFVTAYGAKPQAAYEELVDRLLASPRYGERWAMFWLDLVRFAETDGFKADDLRPDAWRYRDYVIRSLNADKPYDRFVREQVAGDELYPDDADALIATGFLRHYPDEYNAVNLEQRRQEILNDITDTTGQVFLGLTLGCARCHDHKFDPITQKDYYRFQAFFAAFWPENAPLGSPEQLAEYRRKTERWQAETAELRKKIEELEAPQRKQLAAKKRMRFVEEYQKLLDTPEAERSPLQQQLWLMISRQCDVDGKEAAKAMKPEVKQQWDELNSRMAELNRLKPSPPATVLAMTDVGAVAPPTHLLKRGEWRLKDREVVPGYLSAIDGRDADVPPPAEGAKTTGRRAELAKWLTDAKNPLTARLMVNRLWQHHFGQGIVATSGDFGVQGEPPTHPELLDWLAVQFVEGGWSLKAMHRLMVTSAAYRQASVGRGRESVSADPDNKLLWRMNRRRLEGEALRDAILAVSGKLSERGGGPSAYPELPPELGVPRGGWPVSPDTADRNRRSVYVFAKRNLRFPLFSAFDAPDGNETCSRRFATTTAPQALMLLNDKLILEDARAFAGRVLAEAGAEPDPVVSRAFSLALGRSPAVAERKALEEFLSRQAEPARGPATQSPDGPDPAFRAAVADLCHALLNLNEFLYVD